MQHPRILCERKSRKKSKVSNRYCWRPQRASRRQTQCCSNSNGREDPSSPIQSQLIFKWITLTELVPTTGSLQSQLLLMSWWYWYACRSWRFVQKFPISNVNESTAVWRLRSFRFEIIFSSKASETAISIIKTSFTCIIQWSTQIFIPYSLV